MYKVDLNSDLDESFGTYKLGRIANENKLCGFKL
jgi:lactam utilization protein B